MRQITPWSSRAPWLGSALLALWLALAPGGPARAAEVVWDANPPAEGVVGYLVAFGAVSRHDPEFTAYPHEVDVGPALRFDLARVGASPTPTYLSVVAYNGFGLRSDYSVELSLPVTAGGGSSGGGGGCFLEALRPSARAR
ncbi:MAG: hypothetical protein ACYDA8_12055 [Deferrisomatales bacterium]